MTGTPASPRSSVKRRVRLPCRAIGAISWRLCTKAGAASRLLRNTAIRLRRCARKRSGRTISDPGMAIDYEAARELLERTFVESEDDLLRQTIPQIPEELHRPF